MTVLPIHVAESSRVVSLIGSRSLQPRDGAVFLALQLFTDPTTSRIEASAGAVAERLGMHLPHVVSSIKRLVEGGVIRRTYNPHTGTHALHLADDIVSPARRRAVVEEWLDESGYEE